MYNFEIHSVSKCTQNVFYVLYLYVIFFTNTSLFLGLKFPSLVQKKCQYTNGKIKQMILNEKYINMCLS